MRERQADTWPSFEPGQPLYSVRNLVHPPGQHMGTGPFAQRLDAVARTAARERAARAKARAQPQDVQTGEAAPLAADAPYPGALRVLRWATHMVLSAGYDQKHPMSNKVEVKVRLRDLAREVGLSPAGVAWIAALCGPRCVRAPGAAPAPALTRRAARLQVRRQDGHAAPGEPPVPDARGQPPRLPAHHQRCVLVIARGVAAPAAGADRMPARAELVDEGAREGGGLDAKAPGAASVLARQAREKAVDAKAPA